jgi:hypothetical protein
MAGVASKGGSNDEQQQGGRGGGAGGDLPVMKGAAVRAELLSRFRETAVLLLLALLAETFGLAPTGAKQRQKAGENDQGDAFEFHVWVFLSE